MTTEGSELIQQTFLGEDPDGLVRYTIGRRGQVIEVWIAPDWQRAGPDGLATAIMAASRAAHQALLRES